MPWRSRPETTPSRGPGPGIRREADESVPSPRRGRRRHPVWGTARRPPVPPPRIRHPLRPFPYRLLRPVRSLRPVRAVREARPRPVPARAGVCGGVPAAPALRMLRRASSSCPWPPDTPAFSVAEPAPPVTPETAAGGAGAAGRIGRIGRTKWTGRIGWIGRTGRIGRTERIGWTGRIGQSGGVVDRPDRAAVGAGSRAAGRVVGRTGAARHRIRWARGPASGVTGASASRRRRRRTGETDLPHTRRKRDGPAASAARGGSRPPVPPWAPCRTGRRRGLRPPLPPPRAVREAGRSTRVRNHRSPQAARGRVGVGPTRVRGARMGV